MTTQASERPSTLSSLMRYGVTIASVAAAMLARYGLDPVLEDQYPFITFFLPVLVGAWVAGTRGGIVATVVGLAVAWFCFVPPRYTFALFASETWVAVLAFLIANGAIALIGGAMHEAQARSRDAEIRARRKREALRITLASIGDAVLTTDMYGKITFLNNIAEELTGWKQSEALGMSLESVFNIVSEQTRAKAENPVEKVLKVGQIVGLANHTILISKNGSECPIDDSAAPIRDESGEILGAVLVFRDIRSRRQIERAEEKAAAEQQRLMRQLQDEQERLKDALQRLGLSEQSVRREHEALRTSEERLRQAMNIGRIFAWSWNLETDEFTQTESGPSITGLESPRGAPDAWSAVHPDDVGSLRTLVDRSLENATDFAVDVRWVRPDNGKIIWLQNRAHIEKDAAGKPARIFGTSIDITERKRADAALEQKTHQLEIVTQTMAAAVTQCSRAMRYVWASSSYADWLKRRPEEIVGAAIVDVVGDHAFEQLQPYFTRVLSGEIVHYEEEVDFQGIGPRWIQCTYTPIFEPDSTVGGWVAVVVDITERRRMEEQLRELTTTLEIRVAERTAEAEARAVQLRALAAEVTNAEQRERRRVAQVLHDGLQQVLAAARMHLGAVRISPDHQSVIGLDRVESLLEQGIIQARTLVFELSPPILHDGGLIRGLEWLARHFQEQHRLAVHIDADPAGEPCDPANREFLFQCSREFLFNITKHAQTNQAWITLHQPEPGMVELKVRDHGIGCDPELARSGNGDCFGLFSIRERVSLMGGALNIRSRPAEGMELVLSVPDKPQPDTERAESPVPAIAQNDSASKVDSERQAARIRVMLADDHTLIREGICTVLAAYPDIEVVGQASDGVQAIELATQLNPDVILMDVSMPRANGVEATRRLTVVSPDVRIIGLSMHEGRDMAAAMLEAGAVDYLYKAESADKLVTAIRAAHTHVLSEY